MIKAENVAGPIKAIGYSTWAPMRKAVLKGAGVFKIHGAPESPHEGKCLRYIMNRSRKLGYMVFSCLQVITVYG